MRSAMSTPPRLDENSKLGRRRIHLREVEDGDDGQLESVGERLRAARLRRGDDIATVSAALKIGKAHLAALESGEIDALPGRAYAVGFVRSYAAYLGLDPVRCSERFKIETWGRAEYAPRVAPPPETYGSGLRGGWWVMALIVAGVVIYGAFHLMRSAGMSSPSAVAPVPARMTAAAPSHPRTSKLASPRRAVAGAPSVQAARAGAGPTAVSAVEPPAAPQTGAPALPVGQVFGGRNQHVRVVLQARTLTRLLVRGPSGKIYLDRILHPGDLYRVPDLVGLSLTTPDGGAVSLELDGQHMGAAGPSGQASRALSLDPQAIVDRSGRRSPG